MWLQQHKAPLVHQRRLANVTESRETEPKVVLENAGWTMLQKTVNAVAGILWKLHG